MLVSFKTIGQHIRVARKAAGLTQEQLAAQLGMSQLHFGRLERGERPASLEQLAQAARTLHVPLSDLLNGSVVEERFTNEPDDSAQALGQSIASLASGCSASTRRLMYRLCQTVAASEKLPDGE